MSAYEPSITVTDREKTLFGQQGFIIAGESLSPEQIQNLDEPLMQIGIKAKKFMQVPRATLLKVQRVLCNSMLTWGQPSCQPFRDLLVPRKLIPHLNTMLGRGWKVDRGFDVVRSERGCEGLHLPIWGNAVFDPARFYHYQLERP